MKRIQELEKERAELMLSDNKNSEVIKELKHS